MNVYIDNNNFYCENCKDEVRNKLIEIGSSEVIRGPYPDGGGETDYPNHCVICGIAFRNKLTPHGVNCVIESLKNYVANDNFSSFHIDEHCRQIENYQLDIEQLFIVKAFKRIRDLENQNYLKFTGHDEKIYKEEF